jgi:hypothetical protein
VAGSRHLPDQRLAASRIVADLGSNADGREHIAFTYLATAYKKMTGT